MSDTVIYSNCKLLSIDGELLSYIGKRRMEWYLKKGLANSISDTEIQLIFNHSGKNIQPKLYTEVRDNICVVCGGNENLTKHHIVPYAFKRYFPLKYKNRTSFDVAVLCVDCHENYERHAYNFKKELMDKYGVSQSNKPYELGIATTLLKHRGDLPDEVHKTLSARLPVGIADSSESLETFIKSFNGKKQNVSELLVTAVPVISDFIIAWRKHFVEFAQPKYMPASWHEEIEFVYSN